LGRFVDGPLIKYEQEAQSAVCGCRTLLSQCEELLTYWFRRLAREKVDKQNA